MGNNFSVFDKNNKIKITNLIFDEDNLLIKFDKADFDYLDIEDKVNQFVIKKVGKNKYALGSLKFKSLYIFELNNQREMIDFQELQLKERIRDLKFKNDNLYLFLEDTASIGVINFK